MDDGKADDWRGGELERTVAQATLASVLLLLCIAAVSVRLALNRAGKREQGDSSREPASPKRSFLSEEGTLEEADHPQELAAKVRNSSRVNFPPYAEDQASSAPTDGGAEAEAAPAWSEHQQTPCSVQSGKEIDEASRRRASDSPGNSSHPRRSSGAGRSATAGGMSPVASPPPNGAHYIL